MEKIIIAIYRFFEGHKILMYSLLAASVVFFALTGFRLQFEEDIFKLLPDTQTSEAKGAAFADIKVKDKIFIELTGEGLDTSQLIDAQEAFVAKMEERDTSFNLIDGFLYKFDADDAMNALYYGLDHLPAFVSEDFYPVIDKVLEEGKANPAEDFDVSSLAGNLPQGQTFISSHLFSRDSTLALVYLSPAFSATDSRTASVLVRNIDRVRSEMTQEYPGVEILYHGAVVDGAFNSRQIKTDLVVSVGFSLILILLVICICFKSRRTLPLLLSPVAYGLLMALSAVYLIHGRMSLIAIGIGAMILGAAMSYCLHVLVHHKYVGDIERLLREQATPVCLGCITTVGAFLGLLFTSSELLQDFGLFATFALLGTTFFALVFLPHFFHEGEDPKNEKAFEIIRKINTVPLHRCKPLVALLGAVCVASLFIAGKVGFDSDLANIGFLKDRVVRSASLYNEKVDSGYKEVYYAAYGSTLDDAILTGRKVNAALDSLRHAGVINSWSSASPLLVPLDEQQANIDRWKEYWTPEKVERGYGMLCKSAETYGWDTPLDIPDTFRMLTEMDFAPECITDTDMLPEQLLCNYVERMSDEGGFLVFSSALLPAGNVVSAGEEIDSIPDALVLDPYFYAGDMVEIIHKDFLMVLGISSLFVFLILLLSFRSLVTSLFAFMPMFFSWYIVQAVMAVTGIEFNLISIMISSFIFGIGVDYSIFMTEGLLEKARGGGDNLLEYHKSAILISVFVLFVVIISLLLSRHPALRSVGVATIIGMGATVLITYTLQPFIFKYLLKCGFLRRRMLHEK